MIDRKKTLDRMPRASRAEVPAAADAQVVVIVEFYPDLGVSLATSFNPQEDPPK
jgi:hypothetical protein